jgi:hypothetical protein
MQTITVTLQQAYQTNPIGPFDIELRDGSDNIYNTDTGVSLEDFLTGRTYTDQSDLITKVHVTSTGEVCQNTIEFPITVEPTPTPTPTPQPQGNLIQLASGAGGASGTACQNALISFNISVYHPTLTTLVNGETYFDGTGNPYNGGMGYFSDGIVVGRIGYTGLYTEETTCQI